MMTGAGIKQDPGGIHFVKIYLKPSELCVSKAPALVTTVLGSCVAVTMYQPELGVSVICHAPQSVCSKQQTECPKHCIDKYHYVSCVIPEMLGHMEAAGAKRELIEVKLFGGATMFSVSANQAVGRQNVETAISVLRHCRLELKARKVGGRRGCKIVFNTHTGEVMLKRIRYSEGWQQKTGGNRAGKGEINSQP
jgi:chemotaxis protein CheD